MLGCLQLQAYIYRLARHASSFSLVCLQMHAQLAPKRHALDLRFLFTVVGIFALWLMCTSSFICRPLEVLCSCQSGRMSHVRFPPWLGCLSVLPPIQRPTARAKGPKKPS